MESLGLLQEAVEFPHLGQIRVRETTGVATHNVLDFLSQRRRPSLKVIGQIHEGVGDGVGGRMSCAKADTSKSVCQLGNIGLLGFRGLQEPFKRGHLAALDLGFPQLWMLVTPGLCLLDNRADEPPDCSTTAMDAIDLGCKERCDRPCYLGHQLQGDGAHEDVLRVTNQGRNPLRVATDIRSDNSSAYHLRDEFQDLGLRSNRCPVLEQALV